MEPTRLTKPLTDSGDGLPVDSDGYRLIELVEKYWIVRGKPLRLDEWQKRLLIRILERCPTGHPRAGQLRYRQVVVSIPRQAGKSLLAAILSLYGLLQHTEAPKVLGVARTVQQANVVYDYAKDAVSQSEALSGVLSPTGTRGISKTTGLGSYKVLPAKAESVQGYESTLSICDELHVMDPRIWDAIVESQTAQLDPLLIGITTAGDIMSVLLKRLYAQGDKAIAGEAETFGFFVWEAPSTELTVENITEANPAIACGRIDAQTIINDCLGMPRSQWMRFRLNLFVEGIAEPWIPMDLWDKCGGTGLEEFKDCVYAIDIGKYTTVVAAKKIGGKVHTTLVCRLVDPSHERLKELVIKLRAKGRCTFIMDGYRRPALLAWMQEKGYEVTTIRNNGMKAEAAKMVYSLVKKQNVNHDRQPFVTKQHANATTKNYQDGFVVVPGKGDADAAYASLYAIYGAEVANPRKGAGIA